jgi:hypothetical protein
MSVEGPAPNRTLHLAAHASCARALPQVNAQAVRRAKVIDRKTAAEIWRRRLRDGLATEAEVKAWADRLIDEDDRPDAWLIDVSMAAGESALNEALELAPGEADGRAVFSGVMASLRDLLDLRPDLDSKIAKALFDMYVNQDVPAQQPLGEMAGFWDDIDLAREGIWGDLEAQRRRLREFLERWSRPD